MTDERQPNQADRKTPHETGSDPAPSPAGPHDKPELTNPDATPGAGSLPSERQGGDSDAGVG